MRTTTVTESVADDFWESISVMTFLTNLWVKRRLYSSSLVLEGKEVKEILESSRSVLLEKILENKTLALSVAEDNLLGLLSGEEDFVENNFHLNMLKVVRA